jgi:hypothetical protein
VKYLILLKMFVRDYYGEPYVRINTKNGYCDVSVKLIGILSLLIVMLILVLQQKVRQPTCPLPPVQAPPPPPPPVIVYYDCTITSTRNATYVPCCVYVSRTECNECNQCNDTSRKLLYCDDAMEQLQRHPYYYANSIDCKSTCTEGIRVRTIQCGMCGSVERTLTVYGTEGNVINSVSSIVDCNDARCTTDINSYTCVNKNGEYVIV